MNGMRKVVCFLFAMMLAAIALPSLAAPKLQKQYSLVMSAGSQTNAGAALTVTASLTNTSPDGNSNIGSFQLSVVGATITGYDPLPSGTATINGTGTSIFVTGIFPLKPTKTFRLTLHLGDCGDKTWSATVWTGSMGQTFAPVAPQVLTPSVSCGDLDCSQAFTVPNSATPGAVAGVRGFYDKDGATSGVCEVVPYFVTDTLAVDQKVHFRWLDDITGDPSAAFQYTVTSSGPTVPPTTQVAWFNNLGTQQSANTGTPDFINALPCEPNANFLPAPYGTLTADSGATITVNATSPALQVTPGTPPGRVALPTVPFDIVIESERMTVTFVDNLDPLTAQDWTVTRAVGGTSTSTHPANLLVMSTPLPIMSVTQGATSPSFPLGQYVAFDQALTCIKAQGPAGSNHFTTFISIGEDPWGSHP